ncbi:ParB/RepB/Spo0J family partition protein [Cellulosilyticum lentocellum]|uniref:ParB-like partition protein n=1 Tax=Cellulosilyticum lentocellum (strain ATCC 49066 / DSM 5427 / NCIMB 11756 / RHM5) TaxID=642492 RepID=F2JNP4_CELLD|nr:ParB/RepB/Spo0J family partition protein [Cellulosilyticum lentocellum]ADZ85933.1 parB-like partition protein [Cellulosilyticum lentocellum DSM 5427]
MKPQRGLGRGLNALLSDEALNITAEGEATIKIVDINDIEPNFGQPRKKFSEEELQELSQSILEYGVIQPLIVREKNNKYEIVAGERRYRAARLAGLTELPIIIKLFSDQQTLEVALIENIQREDLNPMELACAYSLLMEHFDLTQEQVADKVGKSRTAVTNIMRLLKLTPYVQEKLREDAISYGHARAILAVKDIKLQKQLTDLVIEKQLSVREIEKYIQNLSSIKDKKKKDKEKELYNPFYREIQEDLQRVLGTRVAISKGAKKGKIEIEYYSDEELSRIIQIINANK